MEAREAFPRGKKLGASNASPTQSTSGTVATATPVAATFEWVQHGDPAARRRARAHVTRGFRREKAEAARLAKANAETQSKSAQAHAKEDVVVEASAVDPEEVTSNAVNVNLNQKTTSQSLVTSSKGTGGYIPSVPSALGSGNTDPFVSLPVQLDARGHAVLRHFLLGVKPVTYNMDSKSDFGPVKTLSFRLALIEPSAFHTICAVGANDMAALQGRRESTLALQHRGQGISLVKKRLAAGDISDSALTGIALLAGHELIFGLPRNYMFHMQGLVMILQPRGGVESLRLSNPDLYSWIHWMDYSGSCNFISKRRFVPSPVRVLTRTDPSGCLEALLQSLPGNYDMFQYMIKTCRQYESLIHLVQNEDEEEKLQKLKSFLNQVDAELVQLVSMTTVTGGKARRPFIEQFLHISRMMIGSVIIRGGTALGDTLFDRLDEVFEGEARALLRLFAELYRMVLSGHTLSDTLLHHRLGKMMDICGPWDWEEWQRMKENMLSFFLTEQICEGSLQTFWRVRKGYVS